VPSAVNIVEGTLLPWGRYWLPLGLLLAALGAATGCPWGCYWLVAGSSMAVAVRLLALLPLRVALT
jgi:tetrahydromethanopterin S-methyltransferase subunit D